MGKAALAMACLVFLPRPAAAEDGLHQEAASYLGMAAVASLRFAAIRWKLRLPVFHVPDDDSKSS